MLCTTAVVGADAELSLDKLQGKWQLVSLTKGGNVAPADELKKANLVLTIEKDGYAVSVNGQVVEKGKLKLDSKAKPASIDQIIEEGKDKGKSQLGIVRVKDGKLQWTQAQVGEKRPTDFASPSGKTDEFGEFEKAKE
jgi:uncharacterized protein (TIGR03067 family)